MQSIAIPNSVAPCSPGNRLRCSPSLYVSAWLAVVVIESGIIQHHRAALLSLSGKWAPLQSLRLRAPLQSAGHSGSVVVTAS